MNINNENINTLLNNYIGFIDDLSLKRNYHPNIKHLLYLIVPAFILKYGIKNENLILKCFSDTKIVVSNKIEKNIQAYFTRSLKSTDNIGYDEYYTEKYVVINDFDNALYIDMIDSIIHEFNHAVNSMNNEIIYDNEFVKLRTGLSYVKYSRTNLKNAISKDKNTILEEIINTKQTEEIFNIIINFSQYNIDNIEFSNMVDTLKRQFGNEKYKSDAYSFQTYICKELIKNKTFVPTVENLRLVGEVQDIENWFDSIVGEVKTFSKLVDLLNEIMKLELDYSIVKWFKKAKIRKIREKSKNVIDIINRFDSACIYK